MSGATPDTVRRIETAFRQAEVTGCLHALDLGSGQEIGVAPDDAVPVASVFKVPLLVTFFQQVAAGVIDPAEQITVRPDARTAGPTGLSVLFDEVRMSLRDLACLMITVSDNTAADAIFSRIGMDAVNTTLAELGLRRTRVVGDCRYLTDSLLADAGAADHEQLWAKLAEPGVPARLRALDPARTSRSSPREMSRLLAMIWQDEAAPALQCAQMRRLLGLQVWPHRLASGFPYDDVRVSGKTGTLPTIRNEVGVVEYPDGGQYAVAVFTRAAALTAVHPRADAVIGTVAHLAVEALRQI